MSNQGDAEVWEPLRACTNTGVGIHSGHMQFPTEQIPKPEPWGKQARHQTCVVVSPASNASAF